MNENLKDLSEFINEQKNFLITTIAILMGAACTFFPVQSEYGGQWVGMAISIAGLYTGHRIEAGKRV